MSDLEVIVAAAGAFGAGLLALGRSTQRMWAAHRKQALELERERAVSEREQGERRIAAVIEQTRSNTLLIERIEASRASVAGAQAELGLKIDKLGEQLNSDAEMRGRTVYRAPDR